MKKVFLLLTVICFSAFSLDSDVDPSIDPGGNLILVKTIGQTEGSEKTGAVMPFQESYNFRSDGAFTKTREVDEETISATGTYTILETEGADQGDFLFSIHLEYQEESPIIANCDDSLTEHLNLTTNYILKSTWEQCDGLSLFYRKVSF